MKKIFKNIIGLFKKHKYNNFCKSCKCKKKCSFSSPGYTLGMCPMKNNMNLVK